MALWQCFFVQTVQAVLLLWFMGVVGSLVFPKGFRVSGFQGFWVVRIRVLGCSYLLCTYVLADSIGEGWVVSRVIFGGIGNWVGTV